MDKSCFRIIDFAIQWFAVLSSEWLQRSKRCHNMFGMVNSSRKFRASSFFCSLSYWCCKNLLNTYYSHFLDKNRFILVGLAGSFIKPSYGLHKSVYHRATISILPSHPPASVTALQQKARRIASARLFFTNCN